MPDTTVQKMLPCPSCVGAMCPRCQGNDFKLLSILHSPDNYSSDKMPGGFT
jgi:hypothetical protein